MPKPVLSYRAFAAALVSRLLDGDTMSVGRESYVGASEVGGCPRLVSYRKALGIPWRPDPEAAGYMLPGRLAENETIQFLRIMGLDRDLSATGRSQVTLSDGNLRSHPDGLLGEDAFDLDPLSTYFKANGQPWDLEELNGVVVGPGITEVKSGSSSVFRAAVRRGISPTYYDQTQGNMGLSGRLWTLVIFVCRDSLSKVALFFIPFNEARYRELHRLSDAIIGSASLARQALLESFPDAQSFVSEHDEDVIAACSEHLLAPDPERGYCMKCPLRHSCPALVKAECDGLFPEAFQAEIDALAEEYSLNAATEKAAKEAKDEARDRVIALGEQCGAGRALLSPPFKALSISEMQGRETCDMHLLKSNFPEAFAACVSRGESYKQIRVSKTKGGSL